MVATRESQSTRSSAIVRVIDSKRGGRFIASLSESWRFRSTTIAFMERDLRLKYRHTVLGLGWLILQPLAIMIIATLTIGRMRPLGDGSIPYSVLVLSALVPWMFFQNAISFGANALVTDAALVRKTSFPRDAAVLGSVLAAALEFLIGLLLFSVIAPWLGVLPSRAWLSLPVLFVILLVLAAGVAIGLAGLNVYYRDFRYVLPYLMFLWFLATPVLYPLDVLSADWQVVFLIANPAASLLEAFRQVLALGELPEVRLLAYGSIGSFLVFIAAYRLFKRFESGMADVI